MKSNFRMISLVACVFLAVSTIGNDGQAQPTRPSMMRVSSYELGGTSALQAAALGEAFLKKFNIRVRTLPLGTDVGKVTSVRLGKTDLSLIAVPAGFFAQEGLYDFGEKNWGPQPLRTVYFNNKNSIFSPATTKKSGIKTIADLKGKRVPHVVGSPNDNVAMQAVLAFGGLTLKDVKSIEFHGYIAACRGLLEGLVDMALLDSMSSSTYEIEASPHGLYWIPMPPENKEGWARLLKLYPLEHPEQSYTGAGLSKDKMVWAMCRPHPTVVTYPQSDQNLVYWFVKGCAESWDLYKDISIAMPTWNIAQMLKVHVPLPWAEGAVRYFKEKNLWTAQMEKDHNELLERQKNLANLWEESVSKSIDENIMDKDWYQYWEKRRNAAFPDFWTQMPIKK